MAGMNEIISKFEKLPTAAKAAAAGGAGLLIYALINRSDNSSNKTSALYTTAEDSTIVGFDTSKAGNSIYLNSNKGSGSSGGNSSANAGSGNNTSSSIGFVDTDSILGSLSTAPQIDINKGSVRMDYTEGNINYSTVYYADGHKDIYKNDRLIGEENYVYIPTAAGGTRVDTLEAAPAVQPVSKNDIIDYDTMLQQSQLQYGIAAAAKDQHGMDAAAAEGQRLRKLGATDAGALEVWDRINGNS